jgi:membrane protein DedA with SNARE-associated domain
MDVRTAAILTDWGPAAVGLWVAIGCAAVPVPVWPLLILAGALAEAGQLAALPVVVAALVGAMAGDAAGYALGRGGGRLRARLAAAPRVAPVLHAAEQRLRENVTAAVFVTRWLVAPLGPYVNIAAGMARIAAWRVFGPALAGRAVWIVGYFALGWVFADALETLGATVGEVARWIGVLAVAGMALWLLRARFRVQRQRRAAGSAARRARNAASAGETG